MQVVINISKEDWEYIKKYANEEVLPVGWRQIINGIPLPEDRESIEKTRAKMRAKSEQNI